MVQSVKKSPTTHPKQPGVFFIAPLQHAQQLKPTDPLNPDLNASSLHRMPTTVKRSRSWCAKAWQLWADQWHVILVGSASGILMNDEDQYKSLYTWVFFLYPPNKNQPNRVKWSLLNWLFYGILWNDWYDLPTNSYLSCQNQQTVGK